jgi:uncharacterized membrane protein
MNKVVFFLLLMAFSAFASITYTVDLDREGDASVTASLVDEQAVIVFLPDDATNFRIAGGEYTTSNNTAVVVPGKTGLTSFSFSSSLLSEKAGSIWTLSFNPPENSITTVFMPPYSTIKNVSPSATRIFSDDSRIQINIDYSKRITVTYGLEDQPTPKTNDLQVEYIILAVAILVAAIIIFWVFRKEEAATQQKEAHATLEVTEAKKQMMETFNENDKIIVDFLLEHGGKSKRNALERSVGISKSSLAVALNRLERRKIIEIDRSATTHYVKLNDYFLKL